MESEQDREPGVPKGDGDRLSPRLRDLALVWRIPVPTEIEPGRIESALRERIKELNCLYAVSQLAERNMYALDEVRTCINMPVEPVLAPKSDIQKMMGDEIQKFLKTKYAGYEIPKKFIFLTEPFSLENGMLTPTLKLKRNVVFSKYKDRIEELYG